MLDIKKNRYYNRSVFFNLSLSLPLVRDKIKGRRGGERMKKYFILFFTKLLVVNRRSVQRKLKDQDVRLVIDLIHQQRVRWNIIKPVGNQFIDARSS